MTQTDESRAGVSLEALRRLRGVIGIRIECAGAYAL